MRVLLIEPCMNNMILSSVPNIEPEEAGFYPPLGLMYIAAYLEQNSDHQVQIIDMPVEKMTYETLEREIKKIGPDVVGIHAVTFTMVDVLLIAKIVKRVNPHIHVCLGGPHVTIYPEETITHSEIGLTGPRGGREGLYQTNKRYSGWKKFGGDRKRDSVQKRKDNN